ncbi:MAG: gamma-glutamyltransferase family protein [Deltaproteobacteria bacterium]|nr:gamma-glutamyltransferase family protein [Deltaproteobacteria bacterium]
MSSVSPIVPAVPGRSAVWGAQGMVASSQPLASALGLDVLRNGGNAFDAAVTMAAVLAATEPMATGPGGDLFAMVHLGATGQRRVLNASGRAPAQLTAESLIDRGHTTMPQRGAHTVTVPGAVDGWVRLLEEHGTWSLADALAPAIAVAEQGYCVAEKTAREWQDAAALLERDADSARHYLPAGRPPQAGQHLCLPALGRTLRLLAREGRSAMYEGAIGDAIVTAVRRAGGHLAHDDLAQHHGTWTEPIATDYRGHTVWQAPPNGQGVLVLLALGILQGLDMRALGREFGSAAHAIIEATRLAFEVRDERLADLSESAVEALLEPAFIYGLRERIDLEHAAPARPRPGGGDTTALTVVDRDRNAVSLLNSLYDDFGSGLTAGETGVVLHGRGACFRLQPGHPNCVGPARRPLHTLLPAMVTRDDALVMVLAVMGAQMQPQGQVQILHHVLDRGLGLQAAIDHPRVGIRDNGAIAVDDGLTTAVVESLFARGHRRAAVDGYLGGAQAIALHDGGSRLEGGSDPRKDGLALGY